MYGKVFKQIFDSSIANNWKTRLVFMDMIVLADSDGVVDMTHESIAARGRYPLEFVLEAIKELEEPDPKSRTCLHDGKRLLRLDEKRCWGWQIVNYIQYRETHCEKSRKEYIRNYMRKYRKTGKQSNVNDVNKNSLPSLPSPSPCTSLSSVKGGTGGSRFEPPTMEQAKLQAAIVGLPDIEVEKFMAYYRSNGWRVGKNPMQSWVGAMSGWQVRWRENTGLKNGNGHQEMSGVDKQIALKDLTEVERRMDSIRCSYSEHQSWNEIDRMLFKDLKDRKHDLKSKLGFSSESTNQQRKDT